LFAGFSAMAKKAPVLKPASVTKKWCGNMKPQASIEQTPTEACFAKIDGIEDERLILYAAFDAKVYEIDDADTKSSTPNSATMPAKSIGHVLTGPNSPAEIRGQFLYLNRRSDSEKATVTVVYGNNSRTIKDLVVSIGNQTYEYENFHEPK
jgi:hypothetical protein